MRENKSNEAFAVHDICVVKTCNHTSCVINFLQEPSENFVLRIIKCINKHAANSSDQKLNSLTAN